MSVDEAKKYMSYDEVHHVPLAVQSVDVMADYWAVRSAGC